MNRGYGDFDAHQDPSDGAHSTGLRKQYDQTVVNLCTPTTVEEQVERGGYTRSDTPVGIEPGQSLPKPKVPSVMAKSRYQGGSAGDVRAAHPGTSTPTPGTTY